MDFGEFVLVRVCPEIESRMRQESRELAKMILVTEMGGSMDKQWQKTNPAASQKYMKLLNAEFETGVEGWAKCTS